MFCGNDAMAMGAYQALVAAGKDKQVKVFGFDGADDVVRLIAEGKIDGNRHAVPEDDGPHGGGVRGRVPEGPIATSPRRCPVAVELVNRSNAGKFGDYGRKEAK